MRREIPTLCDFYSAVSDELLTVREKHDSSLKPLDLGLSMEDSAVMKPMSKPTNPANDMLREQRWKGLAASSMEVQIIQNLLLSQPPPEPPKSTQHAGTNGLFLAKLLWVQLCANNRRKLDEVCQFKFSYSAIPTLRTRLILRTGVLSGYKEK